MNLNQALFGVYPYIALSVLAIGSVVRFDREQYTWRSGSSQLLRRRQLMLGSVLFHLGVLMIFAGHVVGLLTPIWIFDALGVPHSAKQMLAIVAGGIAGVLGLCGGLVLLHRRLTDPRIRKTSSFSDIAILVLLVAQLCLGLATIPTSLEHRDAVDQDHPGHRFDVRHRKLRHYASDRSSSTPLGVRPPELATATLALVTCRGPASPRSWVTASWIRPMPWVRPWESWPP